MKTMGYCVKVGPKFTGRIKKRSQLPLHPDHRIGQLIGGSFESQREQRNALAEIVMELRCNSASFFLLRMNQ